MLKTTLSRLGPGGIWFWIDFVLVLVIVFNVWPNLAISLRDHPWIIGAFLGVMFLIGGFWRAVRKR
jgi:hypothetical protein